MTHRFISPRLLPSFLLSLSVIGPTAACGGDDSSLTTADETGTSSGDGDGDMSGDGDGDPATGDGDGDGDMSGDGDGDGDMSGDGDGDMSGDGDGDMSGDGDGDMSGDGDGDPGTCKVWEIEYDLDGSEFEISQTPLGAGDQLNVVEEPYDDDENVGPGSFVVRFADVDGQPDGSAWIVSYTMDLNFTVDGATTIETDLDQAAGPDECGLTSAMLDGDVATWDPLELNDYSSTGTITCYGNFCGLAGFEDGVPEDIDDMGPGPLDPFSFSGDRSTFTTETFIVQQDGQSTTTWFYTGAEISRQLIDAPDCLCN